MNKIYFSKSLKNELMDLCNGNYPEYARGVIVTKEREDHPDGLYMFKKNEKVVNDNVLTMYESFGPYYKKHKGFMVNPLEMLRIEKSMKNNREWICGIFHVHIDFPACPTKLDIDMFYNSVSCPDKVWYLIISYLDPDNVDIRAFYFENKLIREIEIVYE
jgi:proteasome lid subunit RPN8/RPN11